MANLVIKGHASRGKEVIEILKKLGGNTNACTMLAGDLKTYGYYINSDGMIDFKHRSGFNYNDIIYSLDGFLERFPYKVGDKVCAFGNKWTVIDAVWDGTIEEVVYKISSDTSEYITTKLSNQLQPYKEENFGECIEKTIQECLFGKEAQMYLNELANKRTEEIVQALKPAKEIMDRKYNVEEYLKVWKETEKGLEVVVNDRFELKEDNGKFYIIKKPVQYPKTYEGCCGIMGISYQAQLSYHIPDAERGNTYLTKERQLLDSLKRLRICRNAYWKIAGEEMGLGQPWEPNWNNDSQFKYIISCRRDKIIKDTNTAKNSILAFPTEKIRDAFYDNFKDMIEECKTFL